MGATGKLENVYSLSIYYYYIKLYNILYSVYIYKQVKATDVWIPIRFRYLSFGCLFVTQKTHKIK